MQARPSSVARIIKCAASLRASAMAPAWMDEEGDNTVREEGTACHHFAHLAAMHTPPTIGDIAPNGIAFDADMQQAISLYLAAISKWDCQAVDYELLLEVPGIGNGTPDAAGIGMHMGQPCIYIADLKYGYRTVDVWPNFQLILYAYAKARSLGLDIANLWAHMTIVQPRAWNKAGPVRTAVMQGGELVKYVLQAIAAVSSAMQASAVATPGKHCDYCPGRAQCPALRSDVTNTVVAMPDALPFEFAENELVFLRNHIAKVSAYMSGLEAQIEHDIRGGKRSGKFEMRRSAGRKVWTDPERVKALATLMNLEITKPAELLTPNQAFDAGMPADVVNMYSTRGPGKVSLEIADASKWASVFGK